MEAVLLDDEQESYRWTKELLESGEDPNVFDHIASTVPLEMAWRMMTYDTQRSDAIVRLLLDHGAQVEPLRELPFDVSSHIVKGSIDVALLMLEQGLTLSWFYSTTQIGEKTCGWDNLLTELLTEKQFTKIDQLRAHGILDYLHVFDGLGDSPLSTMADEGDREAAQWLIGQGADINAHSLSQIGSTPLDRAVNNHDLKTVEFLLNRGANPNIPTWMWITATDRVSKHGPAKKKGRHDASKDADLVEIKRLVLEACKKFPTPIYPNGTSPGVWPPDPGGKSR